MDAARRLRLRDILQEAIKWPPNERSALVRDLCRDDADLRAEVEDLLKDDIAAQAFLAGFGGSTESLEESPPDTASYLRPGTALGGYVIERALGRGGMGEVLLAYDRTLRRKVALKVLASSDRGRSRSALLREARNASTLNHQHICTIYQVGEEDGRAFIAMEYVEGRTLADLVASGPSPIKDVCRYGIELADALEYAHSHGVVHRDLKARNVICSPTGQLKIVDFGLARRIDVLTAEATTVTGPNERLGGGTPYAMAPEQIRATSTDARTDIWALGVLLFELSTGARPFTGRTTAELFSAILRDSPRPLPPTLPRMFYDVVERCLAKEPSQRYQHASDVRIGLEGVSRARSRWRVGRSAVLAGALLLSAIAAVVWWQRSATVGDQTIRQSQALITSTPNREFGSQLSPDGRWVSWLARPGVGTQVFVQSVNGGDVHQLTLPEGDVVSQVWSPDNRQIACLIIASGQLTIHMVPAVLGGPPIRSVPLQIKATAPPRLLRWVDGAMFLEIDRGGKGLFRVDLDAASTTQLSDAWHLKGAFRGFDVSEDGQTVVYVLSDEAQDGLWVASIDGSDARRLIYDAFPKRNPLLLSRRGVVVFQSNRGGQMQLWEYSLDSKGIAELTSSEAQDVPEGASADGSAITFQRTTVTSSLFKVPLSGGQSQPVTSDALSDRSPTMSRDGGLLAFQRTPPLAVTSLPIASGNLMVAAMREPTSPIDPQLIGPGFYPQLSPDGTRLASLARHQPEDGTFTLSFTDLKTRLSTLVTKTCLTPDVLPTPLDWASQAVAWADNGQTLYYATREGIDRGADLAAYDLSTNQEKVLVTTSPGQSIIDIYPSPDGRVAYLRRLGQRSMALEVWDSRSGSFVSVASFEGLTASLRGWRKDGALVIAKNSGEPHLDATRTVELVYFTLGGKSEHWATIDGAYRPTVRFDRDRGIAFATRVNSAVQNLVVIRPNRSRPEQLTDNLALTASLSAPLTLRDGSVLYVRSEHREEIWLLRPMAAGR